VRGPIHPAKKWVAWDGSNIGPFMEFKGNTDLTIACDRSSLKCKDGQVQCPTGSGFGVTIDADFVKRTQPV
jgi:hypothetical protein